MAPKRDPKRAKRNAAAIVLSDELYASIFQFADAKDLCALDLVCRNFQISTEHAWKQLAMNRFGIELENGKHAWRRGIALTKPKHKYVLELRDPPDFGWLYGG